MTEKKSELYNRKPRMRSQHEIFLQHRFQRGVSCKVITAEDTI